MNRWEYKAVYRVLDAPVELKHFGRLGLQHVQVAADTLNGDWELVSHAFFDLRGNVILSLIFRQPRL
jgi:hypothetical protein